MAGPDRLRRIAKISLPCPRTSDARGLDGHVRHATSDTAGVAGEINVRHAFLATALLFTLPTGASAAEYLTSVTSEVYQTNGSASEIAGRGNRCIAQHLKPGFVDAP